MNIFIAEPSKGAQEQNHDLKRSSVFTLNRKFNMLRFNKQVQGNCKFNNKFVGRVDTGLKSSFLPMTFFFWIY